MRNSRLAISTGLRRRAINAPTVIDPDGDDDVVTVNPTSGQTVEFDLDQGNKRRQRLVGDCITLTAIDSLVLELRRVSDGLYEQGATAYRFTEYDQGSLETDPVNGPNIPMGDFNPGRGCINIIVDIGGAGFACPTSVYSRDFDDATETHDGQVRGTDLHDMVRIRVVGAATFVSGTFELLRME